MRSSSSAVERRDLGGTGLVSSRLVLGTMTFGSQVDQAGANAMVDAALDSGIDHFDTANVYNGGAAEEMLGRALGRRRSRAVVATKVRNTVHGGRDGSGLGRAAIRAALEGSLRRLQTDYVDLYYLHAPDRDVLVEETLATMAELVAQGMVRHVGFSNYAAWQVADMGWLAAANGWPAPRIGQQLYNAISRALEEEYAEFAATHGVATLAYNPLAGGLLTAKHRGATEPPIGRFASSERYRRRYWSREQAGAVEELAVVAGGAGLSPVELAFGWLLAQPVVDAIVLGASSLEQLQVDVAACDRGPVGEEVLRAVDGVWSQLRGAFPRYNR